MRLGASLRTAYAPMDARAGAQAVIERAIAARDAGLDSLFIGDHHATGPFPYYQNVPMMGRLLAEWDDRPAGVLMLLPLWPPVLAAEQLGTLASIAKGRFILQCALGAGEHQFGAMGQTERTRPSRFEAGLDIIRRLLAGEKVNMDEPYQVREARIAPIPPEPLEVWIGASADKAIDRAARMGDGWMADAGVTPDEARDQAEKYRAACERHGRTPTALAIRRDVHVGADDADAARVAEPVIEAGYRGFRSEAVTYGSAQTVAERFAAYAEMGYTDVIVRHLADDQSEVLGSLERLAEVHELLRDA
ncbi:MAG: LLM class flavin-dependent oxidoreductase [Actinobacteria bacterium]|nr:LLM class flavin-dependent oxidoreductase [Actinomycetota bacterium]